MNREIKISLKEYIESLPEFKKDYDKITISESLVQSFRNKFPSGGVIIIVTASWCKDCKKLIPRFGKISEMLSEWKVIVLKRDMLSYEDRINLNIQHIPTFIFYNEKKLEIGRIVEKLQADTLEEELTNL